MYFNSNSVLIIYSKLEMETKNYKTIEIDGGIYFTHHTQKYENKKDYKPKESNHITAFIPGTIEALNVKEEQIVENGQLLVVLGAMKMKNQILSPFNAIVKKINVNIGDIVPKNFVIIELTKIETQE